MPLVKDVLGERDRYHGELGGELWGTVKVSRGFPGSENIFFFFFLIFIYLVALGLSCGRRASLVAACRLLSCGRQAGSLVVACKLLVAACMWDLVPQPGIEPGPPALGAQSLNHHATREVPENIF